MKQQILQDISDYYTSSLLKYGTTPRGVDWNGEASQVLRFKQLIRMIEANRPFSIIDFGCGYGATYPFLKEVFTDFRYCGFDISLKMIEAARKLHQENVSCEWTHRGDALSKCDYVIASGIFNVRLDYADDVWHGHVVNALSSLNELSIKGFSFNMLTTFSDPEYRRPDLYYADPAFYFRYCKDHFSRFVTLYHDYPLYEFTLSVKKEIT